HCNCDIQRGAVPSSCHSWRGIFPVLNPSPAAIGQPLLYAAHSNALRKHAGDFEVAQVLRNQGRRQVRDVAVLTEPALPYPLPEATGRDQRVTTLLLLDAVEQRQGGAL